MRILAFLLFFQSIAACQQEMIQSLASNNLLQSGRASPQAPEKVLPSATQLVFQSTDGGQTWQDVSEGLPLFLEIGCIYAGNGEVLLGSESGLYHSSTASPVPVWQPDSVYLPEKITSILPGRAGTYVCSYGKGFFQETSPGIWKPLHTALADKRIRSILETPDGTIFVASESGIFKSTDHTKTWKQVSTETLVFNLVSANGVLIGDSFQGILRSTDGGEHWDWALNEAGATFQTGLIEGGIAAISHNGTTRRTYTTTDYGKTWEQMEHSAAPVRFLSDIKQSGKYLFYGAEAGIYRSSDHGKTWQLVLPVIGKRAFDVVVSGKTVYAVRLVGC